MQVTYRFKLYPSLKQVSRLIQWQNKIRSLLNVCLADRIDSYQDTFMQGEFCNLRSRGVASPLACSIHKSASLGEYWKENNPSKRRGDKSKLFNPRRSAYEIHSSFATSWRQTKPWYQDVNSDVLQQGLRNQNKAFGNFFSGRANFPRFKRTRDIGLEFKPGTVRIQENKIKFPSLGWMKFALSREISNNWSIRTVTITREIDIWYVSVLLKDETIPDYSQKSATELNTIIGCDVGINKIAAFSNGEIETNPRIGERFERRLKIRQRRLSRKKKGSNNRQKAGIAVAKVHRDIRRCRQDFQWKLGKKIAAMGDIIAFEALNIQGMKKRCKPKFCSQTGKYLSNNQKSKSQLNKAISDAAWYSLRQKTQHQAAKLGTWVIEVNPRGSSQECCKCHYISPKNRDKEKFVCENCGHYDDADLNAGNILAQRGKEKLGIDTLTVVSRKVTTEPELTGASGNRKNISSAMVDESGNPALFVQLKLFSDWEWNTG
ncbi:RNA-guided endonuclease TnpB family protein [Myxosarcina sp. GI1]|uniref:RNA-guided endonuclease InsQ/TnpB family protein n=1 Tax=Myxosarcina sp. GI1 TaxID=1541065 RepID=UPI0005634A41|nr:RNA-guided endonuclease TnpB family protein [Myxosarcina sp. GI1]